MTQQIDSAKSRKIASRSCLPLAAESNTLKAQFLRDMELAGLAVTSRRTYLDAVEQLVRYYWCGPHELTEQQVSDYLLERHRDNVPKGSFKVLRFALRFFFGQTLGRDWHLLKKNALTLSVPFAQGLGPCCLPATDPYDSSSRLSRLSADDVFLRTASGGSGQD